MMARLVQSQLIRGMTAFFQRDPRLAEQVTQKDDQVDNLLGLIEVKKVAALNLPVADARLEDERVVVTIGCADLSDAAPFVKGAENCRQDSSHSIATVIRLEDHRTAEDHVIR